MTDEERQKLCAKLRSMYDDWWCDCDREPCEAAADELERLAADAEQWKMIANALVQPDAEPFPQPQRNDGGEPCGECQYRQALKDAKDYIESSIFNVPSKEKTDEILSKIDTALAQSKAEPVAWREVLDEGLFDLVELARDKKGEQWLHPSGALVNEFGNRIASLAAPPRPDASAGLIEAAEMAEEEEKAGGAVGSFVLRDFAIKLRSRAAGRSGK